MMINILRAVAFGGVQHSGIAQLTLLVVCEIILILVINAVRPYSPKTSMNLYQTFFASMRLLTVVFMMVFIPELKIADSTKGWIAYAILLCHGIVMVFGFFLNALQTAAEVIARLMGAGNDGGTAARGGLAQVCHRLFSTTPTPSFHGSSALADIRLPPDAPVRLDLLK